MQNTLEWKCYWIVWTAWISAKHKYKLENKNVPRKVLLLLLKCYKQAPPSVEDNHQSPYSITASGDTSQTV